MTRFLKSVFACVLTFLLILPLFGAAGRTATTQSNQEQMPTTKAFSEMPDGELLARSLEQTADDLAKGNLAKSNVVLQQIVVIALRDRQFPSSAADAEAHPYLRWNAEVAIQAVRVAWLIDEETGRTLAAKLSQSPNAVVSNMADEVLRSQPRKVDLVVTGTTLDDCLDGVRCLMDSGSVPLRVRAVSALGEVARRSGQRAVGEEIQQFVRVLERANETNRFEWTVRYSVVDAAVCLGVTRPEVRALLEQMSKDSNSLVRQHAQQILSP